MEDKTKLDFELLKKPIDQLEEEKASLSRETSDLRSEMKAVLERSEIQQFITAHLEESLALWKAEVKDLVIMEKETTHPKARLEMHNS